MKDWELVALNVSPENKKLSNTLFSIHILKPVSQFYCLFLYIYFADIFLSSDIKSPTRILLSPSSSNASELGDTTDSFSELSTLDGEEINEELILENRCFQELEIQKNFLEEADKEIILQDVSVAIDALLTDSDGLDNLQKKKIRQYQQEINRSQLGWAKLSIENDLYILAGLFYEWVEGLKQPVLGMKNFESIVIYYKHPEFCFQKFLEVRPCLLNVLVTI